MHFPSASANTGRSVQTKICGVTNAPDALAAVDAGAEMLGFNFYPKSRRFIEPHEAAAIIRRVRQRAPVQCVGVFVDAEPQEICEIAAQSGVDAVQLHGNEGPEYCHILRPLRVIKALRVHAGFDPAVARQFECDTILLDTWHPNEPGGTGAAFDWALAAEIRANVERLILAGGLTPANVAAAIHQVQPDAVDVCSGVEETPRRKSAGRMREFIEAVRAATLAEGTCAAQRTE